MLHLKQNLKFVIENETKTAFVGVRYGNRASLHFHQYGRQQQTGKRIIMGGNLSQLNLSQKKKKKNTREMRLHTYGHPSSDVSLSFFLFLPSLPKSYPALTLNVAHPRPTKVFCCNEMS
jgi:hypothetical protein